MRLHLPVQLLTAVMAFYATASVGMSDQTTTSGSTLTIPTSSCTAIVAKDFSKCADYVFERFGEDYDYSGLTEVLGNQEGNTKYAYITGGFGIELLSGNYETSETLASTDYFFTINDVFGIIEGISRTQCHDLSIKITGYESGDITDYYNATEYVEGMTPAFYAARGAENYGAWYYGNFTPIGGSLYIEVANPE